MTQKETIHTALKIIKNRLPKSFYVPNVSIYKTPHSMIKAVARSEGVTYKEMCNWYLRYLKKMKNKKTYYIKSKYSDFKIVKHRKRYLEFRAIATNPISINIENTKYFKLRHYIYLLLHEVAHHYYKKKGNLPNEKEADLFAFRWLRRMNKEKKNGKKYSTYRYSCI